MWAGEDDLRESFGDIEALAQSCRFKDCRHEKEPGCAVQAAIKNGSLEAERFESYVKLRSELQFHEARLNGNERRLERSKWKKISQAQKTRKDF